MSQPDFVGELNFQSEAVPRALAATGAVYAVVDSATGGFKEFVGTQAGPVPTPIFNGRLQPGLTLDTAGFELRQQPLPAVDFYNEDQVLTAYYAEVCSFVKEALGAHQVRPTAAQRCACPVQLPPVRPPSSSLCAVSSAAVQVYAFDHVVRNTDVSMKYAVKDGVKVGGPALMVHGDYAMLGAPLRRDHFFLPPKQDDTFIKTHGSRPLISPAEQAGLQGRRFAIVNLWRSFVDAPVLDLPLTMCDCNTVSKDDYTAVEFRYSDRTFETYVGHHSDGQRWYYFPEMTKDEVLHTAASITAASVCRRHLPVSPTHTSAMRCVCQVVLLKTYDSQGVLWKEHEGYPAYHAAEPAIPVSSTLHSAVKDPRLTGDYPKRQSIEVRTIVFY